MKNLTWQNPGALGFATFHKQELFVAQELINKGNQSVAELRINRAFALSNVFFTTTEITGTTAGMGATAGCHKVTYTPHILKKCFLDT